MDFTFVTYQDSAGEWRWRLRSSNGNTVADSGEGYATRSNARRAARAMKRSVYRALVV